MVNINAIYIILKKQGLCLFAKTLEKDFPDPDLISPLLISVEAFTAEVMKGEIKGFQIESRNQTTFYFRNFHKFSVVISFDRLYEKIDFLMEKIGLSFMVEHGDQFEPWTGSIKSFQRYETTLQRLLEEFGFEKEMWKVIFPVQALDALNLNKLSKEMRPVALTLLTIREGTLDDITAEMELKKPVKTEIIEFVSHTLDYLVEEGLCGYNHHSKSYFLR
ncbi:MAG: hypothetical protein ACFFCZ_11365 [Promethearchaeota archaeon]